MRYNQWILSEKGKCLKTLLILPTLFILFITGCAPKQESPIPFDMADGNWVRFNDISQANLRPFTWEDIDGWGDDDFQESFVVFKSSCEKTLFNDLLFRDVCREIKNATDPRLFFETYFNPFKLYNDDGTDRGTITGYYEPLLEGSRTKSARYRFPVYKRPDDLLQIKMESLYPDLAGYRLRGRIEGNTVVPYYTREEISKMPDLAETICYVDDDIDLFFLHIQGSGRIHLDSGEIINIGYADQNGYKYQSIGKMLIAKGIIQTGQGSLQGMKKFLTENPEIKEDILNYNPSYIFFSENDRKATGSLGVELTPQRSIAVDTRYIPLGSPVFISTKNPATKEEINRLVFAQDRGGAIKGTIRADYFWGFGKKAEDFAGIMKELGSLWVLLPKSVTDRTE